jgi:hypothetical protein
MPSDTERVADPPPPNQQTDAQKKKASAAEKDYKSALDKIPNKTVADPWGGMR